VRRFILCLSIAITSVIVGFPVLVLLRAQDGADVFRNPPENKKGGRGRIGGATTLPENMVIADGFKVERLYVVNAETEGSWVAMTVDPQGRLVAGGRDDKGVFRITPPALGGKAEDTKVEKLKLDISSPNGLFFAFDSLYLMKCGGGRGGSNQPSGLYRITASQPGGELDTITLLRPLNGGGDHGPHAIMYSPDKKSLTVVCGNSTRVTEFSNSYLPQLWGEDALYPLLSAFSGVVPPAGWIAKVDSEGKNWELYSAGFRNEYDAAYNHNGDLFTYDSDMEWDIGLPWYRPTRISMAVSGGDAGFRNGSRVMPPRYPDSVPPIVDIGLGSPTGVCFGYGAKFPAKYQEALFVNDWSFGRIFAVHLTPKDSYYTATVETFISGPGMSLTDMVVNPADGALYFCVGGNSQSALYRVTYVGNESAAPAKNDDTFADQRAIRHHLESFHGHKDPQAVPTAWPFLSSNDRFLRFAARVAIEHQDIAEWKERALSESNPVASIQALLALVRAVGKDPITSRRKAGDPIPGEEMKGPILDALQRIDISKFDEAMKSELLRVYAVAINRLGKPDDAQRDQIVKRFDPMFPARMADEKFGLNVDLCELLCYLEAPGIQAKTMNLMEEAAKRPAPPTKFWTNTTYQGPVAPTQMEEQSYAWHLAYVKTGWTESLRDRIGALWTDRLDTFRGGNYFNGAVRTMRQQAEQNSEVKEQQ